ncbi:hypothetical protein [Agrobacterium tumefaciens]|uniref:Uncharacterized protein n=1 Tax=Agrobacterium tumefaciens TaxID=358 RepID=A0A2L2LI47_AGRTU|nr:hypothetical protein [Agrobacterium tumefaciens]AVH40618.1 hypothetical protein At1D1609_05660 [Agrobacterium tumefaciens]AVH43997.1 hypothetical protein At1D1609_39500 [Agrobacterium tumefaciens]NSY97930.1 hypothetical protein [Agrobacterium tumefaciens]
MSELYNQIQHPQYAGLANTVSPGAKGISPASPIDEVRDALTAAKSLAYQIAALTDTLCGGLPESTGGPRAPRPGSIIPDLAHDASETSMAIAKANSDINRLMRTFGI